MKYAAPPFNVQITCFRSSYSNIIQMSKENAPDKLNMPYRSVTGPVAVSHRYSVDT